MARHIDQKQIIAGTLFLAIGVTAVFLSRKMDPGNSTRIGPGGFPLLIGGVLTVLGLINLAVGVVSRTREQVSWRESRAAVLIPVSVVVFAFVIDSFGLIPAIIAAVLICGWAAPNPRIRDVLLSAAGLAVAGAGIFVYGLGLPFSLVLWPW